MGDMRTDGCSGRVRKKLKIGVCLTDEDGNVVDREDIIVKWYKGDDNPIEELKELHGIDAGSVVLDAMESEFTRQAPEALKRLLTRNM